MKRIIKRYENRKMYDTSDGKHVSLEEIAVLIRKGDNVKIIDNTNGKDITVQTLTHVILEEGKKGQNPFSSDTLHRVIRWGNSVLDESLNQVKQSLNEFIPESVNEILNGNRFKEVEQLKKRVANIETMLNDLLTNENSQNS